jgi:hypothetical protein
VKNYQTTKIEPIKEEHNLFSAVKSPRGDYKIESPPKFVLDRVDTEPESDANLESLEVRASGPSLYQYDK